MDDGLTHLDHESTTQVIDMAATLQSSLFGNATVLQPDLDGDNQKALGQYMTPAWASSALVEKYFADLNAGDRVVEPSCGTGSFLRAIPASTEAVGIEIDARLADQARRSTGRPVIVGDFLAVDLPFRPTAIIGNPPFSVPTIESFLDRAWEVMEEEGKVGFILPAFAFQTSATVERMTRNWHVQQDMLPRDLFHGLKYPLCFAMLTKGKLKGMVGFSLYHELAAVNRLQKRYRELLSSGEGSVWAAVTRAAMESLGGEADLSRIYSEIEGHRPTTNNFWQAKVRQTLQRIATRTGAGIWKLDVSTQEAMA